MTRLRRISGAGLCAALAVVLGLSLGACGGGHGDGDHGAPHSSSTGGGEGHGPDKGAEHGPDKGAGHGPDKGAGHGPDQGAAAGEGHGGPDAGAEAGSRSGPEPGANDGAKAPQVGAQGHGDEAGAHGVKPGVAAGSAGSDRAAGADRSAGAGGADGPGKAADDGASPINHASDVASEIQDAAEAAEEGTSSPAERSAQESFAVAAGLAGADRDGATVAEEFTAEVRAVRDWLSLSTIFLLGALVALAWFSTQLIQWLIRLGYRLGIERARWVDNFGMVGRLGIWAWAVMMILIRAWRIAPMITLFATGLVAAGLMVGLVKHFENLSTGFGLALRGRIKVGDQITLGPHTGMVRHIGLMQLHLRTAEGSVFLPNRLLVGEALSIGRSRNSYPLRARLTAARAWPPKALEAARCVAMLSPYRDVNSRVNVHCEPEDGRALIVELQVWSPRLLDAADKHLRTMLEDNLRTMVTDDELD